MNAPPETPDEAVRQVAWFVPPRLTEAAPAEHAIRAVAVPVYDPKWRWYRSVRSVLEATLAGGLPVPVLTVARASGQEVGWTQYLAHVLDSDAPHGLGRHLTRRLFLALDIPPPVGQVRVRAEVGLPETRCRGEVISGNSLDLVISDDVHAIAIENKIGSPEGTRPCSHCGRHNQLDDYRAALDSEQGAHVFGGARAIRFVFLTRGDTSRTGWLSLTHRNLAEIFAGALDEALTPHQASSLISLIMDLDAARLGGWQDRLNSARSLLYSDGGRARSLSPVEAARLHTLINGDALLEAILCRGARPISKPRLKQENLMESLPVAGLAYLEHVAALNVARKDATQYLSELWKGVVGALPARALSQVAWRAAAVVSTQAVGEYGVDLWSSDVRGDLVPPDLGASLGVVARDFREEWLGAPDGRFIQVVLTTGAVPRTRALAVRLGEQFERFRRELPTGWERVDNSQIIGRTSVRLSGQLADDIAAVAQVLITGTELYEDLLRRASVQPR